MKKVLVTLFVLFIITSTSFAQFKIGPRFGINLSSVSDDPDYGAGVEQSSHFGFLFGAAAELGIAGPMYAEVELLYIQKGEDLKGQDQLGNPAEQIFTANYLEIPILVKAKFPLGPVSPYAFVGPNIGILLSANSEFTSGGQTQDTDIKDNMTSIDFALDFGAGVGFNVMPMMSLVFDVRYSLGLSDIVDPQQQPGQQTQESTEKTRGFQIMLGAMFGL
jgi:opacity protein-like surface antigen